MITATATFPNEPQHSEEITFGQVQVRARFSWRPRLQAWYLDLYDTDRNPILLARRLSESSDPTFGHALSAELDRDVFTLVQGPSPYQREDLGARLMLLLIPRDDLPEGTTVTYPLTITVQ